MIFEPGQTIAGFTISRIDEIPDIEATAYIGRHGASGARLLYLACDDEDKAFTIGFRTPPKDDTGVFHILEHSVLCGSEKFPVKEPFVNLLQGSMQTFLNAMTFPDKTIYPVASTNDKDLMNLADVYMDAVLHPAIFADPNIFRQEGWHYEVEEGHPALNGVVLNEMKGAYGDPEAPLGLAMQRALFPDTCYGFESGGYPDSIPDLTYGEFLNEHRRHYRLDNSFIILYGNLNAEAMLTFLDEKYLAPWAAAHAGDAGEFIPRTVDLQAPVTPDEVEITAVTTPDNEMEALGFVLPAGRSRLEMLATGILLSAMTGTNESPLRRALLDADLADSITFPLVEEIRQPYVTLLARGLHEGARGRLEPAFREILTDLIAKGFDKEALLASLARTEFSLRERDFGGWSAGVMYAMTVLSSWLYDEEAATTELHFAEELAELRRLIETDYFEGLAAALFLSNDHVAKVHLAPVPETPDTPEARRLAALEAAWTPEDFARADEVLAELRARQERPDSPEELATLPKLGLSDLAEAAERPGWHTEERDGKTLLVHEVPTAGIGYFTIVLPADRLAFEDLPYLSIMARLIGHLNTSSHTALELDTLSLLHLGGFSFRPTVMDEDADERAVHPLLMASASSLLPETAFAAEYLAELLCDTDFSDLARIRTMAIQWKIGMEDSFVNAGNMVARQHVDASFCPATAAGEHLGGIPFYRFLKDLVEHWDERSAELPGHLVKVARTCAQAARSTVCAAGGDEAVESFFAAWNGSLERRGITAAEGEAAPFAVPALAGAQDAFTVPGNVSFTALGCDVRAVVRELGWPAQESALRLRGGSWDVARAMLSFDFLWNEVRVKGGAYGVGFTRDLFRNVGFSSFRDPRIDETLERYAASAKWLAETDFTPEELEGYIISTVANFDKPVKPRALSAAQVIAYLRGRAKDLRLVCRAEALATTPADLRRIGEDLMALVPLMHRCTVGAPAIIAAAKTPYEVQPLVETE